MKYCQYCGGQINDDANFCRFCGGKVIQEQQYSPVVIEEESYTIQWKQKAEKIYTALLITSIGALICTIYESYYSLMEIFHFVRQLFPISVGGFGDSIVGYRVLKIILNLIVIAGYYNLLTGFKEFAGLQRLQSTKNYLDEIRSATVLLIVVYIVNLVFGIMFSVPFIGYVYRFAIWIVLIITYVRMKRAYKGLAESIDFSPYAQIGLKNARFAAQCQFNLLVYPLVALLVGVLFFFLILNAPGRNSISAGLGFITAMAAIMGVVCLAWTFIAFLWPLLGWYKIKEGGPNLKEIDSKSTPEVESISVAEEETTVFYKENSEDSPNPQMSPLYGMDNQPDIYKKPIETETSKFEIPSALITFIQRHWKKIAIAAGVIVLCFIGYKLIKHHNNKSSQIQIESPLLHLKVPVWNQFVVVTGSNIKVYKNPDESGPYLMVEAYTFDTDAFEGEYLWSDESVKDGMDARVETLSGGGYGCREILPVVGVEGDFYKVYRSQYGIGAVCGYIKKDECQEITPAPITHDIARQLLNRDDNSCFLIDEGEKKGLCFMFLYSEIEDSEFSMGELIDDNRLVFPQDINIATERDENYHGPMSCKKMYDESGTAFYKMLFDESSMKRINHEYWVFDAKKMTPELANEMYSTIDCSSVTTLLIYYYFPNESDYLYPIYYKVDTSIVSGSESGENNTTVLEPGNGDLPLFDLHGPVKSVRMSMEFSDDDLFEFDKNGALVNCEGESIEKCYQEISYNRDGKLKGFWVPPATYEFTYEKGKLNTITTYVRLYKFIYKYEYNSAGEVVKIIEQSREGDVDDSQMDSKPYDITIIERDSYGNWTKRRVVSHDKNEIETRVITYYD